MRVHLFSIATISVALLFVSGNVGCRSNGGDWYNPKSYTFANPFTKMNNPFAKNNQAPPYSSDSAASTKPSANSKPNISPPPGGYTDGTVSTGLASRTGSTYGTTSLTPPEHWGQQNPIAQQNSSNPLGGYSVPEPSQYSTYADYNGQGVVPPSGQYAQNQNPYQYQPEMVQQTNSSMPYGVDPMQSSVYQATSVHSSQQPGNSIPAGAYGGAGQPSPYAPFGQSDPYASMQQQIVPPPIPSYEQPYQQPYQQPYMGMGEGVPGASPYQPYQPYQPPAVTGGYNYNY